MFCKFDYKQTYCTYLKLKEEVFVLCFSKRQKIHVSALRVWSVDDPHPQEEASSK